MRVPFIVSQTQAREIKERMGGMYRKLSDQALGLLK
jgi:hypothetical protein